MVFAALAARAGTVVVQAMVTEGWESVRLEVARQFGGGQPDSTIERRLNATHEQLAATSPAEMASAQTALAVQWQTRFADLLADHPDAEAELAALVNKLRSSIALAAEAIPDSKWQTATQNFMLGRYDRVQAAAQTWLTIMTTLFGVFSTVVVLGGAKTISDIQGGLGWRIGVVAGSALVFLLALAATMYGLFASWGGLGSLKDETHDPEHPPSGWQDLKDMWSPQGLTPGQFEHPDWQMYRTYTLARANQNRKRLHRSRVLGVAAVIFAGLLGFAFIINGLIY
jgi:hypothetical protein